MQYFRIIKKSWFVCCLIVLSGIYAYRYISRPIIQCQNAFEVQDYTESKEGAIRICDDKLYRGSTLVIDKNNFPDLFQFTLNKDSSPTKTKHRIRIFEMGKGKEYVSIISVIDWTTWYNSAIGIYRKEGKEYKLVFKKSFSDSTGRWVFIRFIPSEPYMDNTTVSISGDIGYLGCWGCRMNWTDYYDWSDKDGTYILANNKHQNEFKILLEEYEKNDKTACKNESNMDVSITNLYSYRNGKDKFCDDAAVAPNISSNQATVFLKAKTAIKEIIYGKNTSMKEIEEI